MFDTTRMIANMVATGTKKRFSNIKIISTHGGGTIPYLVNRIQMLEHAFGVAPGRLALSPEEVREGIASFYYDLTAATSEAQLGAILKLVPVSRFPAHAEIDICAGHRRHWTLPGIQPRRSAKPVVRQCRSFVPGA
jgi:hypothetical protein